MVAVIGVTVAAILVASVAAGVWWTLQSETVSAASTRKQEVQTAAELLAVSSESLMAGDNLSPVRRMITEAARRHQLDRIRISLPDGQVVADGDPTKITLINLPATWQGGQVVQASTTQDQDGVSVTMPIDVTGRGPAKLELFGTIQRPTWLASAAQAGLAAIGAGGLIALWLVYRSTRSRLRALGAIRESLLAIEKGEESDSALSLSPNFGHEAQAWNRLLNDRSELRRKAAMERSKEALVGTGGADLRGACDAISQGMILVDDTLVVQYANGAAATFLQAKRDLIVGGTITRFIRDENLVACINEAAVSGSRKRSTLEIEYATDEGTGVLRYHVRPVRREDRASAMILIEDITQQRVADESRNQFVAQATHELRTPLTNIRLYVETALEEGEKDPALREKSLNVINQESRRLERIVDDMLKVSEIEAGSLKLNHDDVRLDQVLADLLVDYEAQAKEKSIVMGFNLAPKLPVIQADRDKVQLAMHNLLGNALKYTPAGGRIAVNVDVADGKVVFEVRDTGIGISKDDQVHLFEKFFRAKDRRVESIVGTGLGLSIAREMARLHGGDITVESELDKGSTFTLTLPTNVEAA